MKRILLILSMLLMTTSVCFADKESDDFTIIGASSFGSNPFGIVGGKDGKIYQVIVKTGKSKQEIIETTAQMLQSMGIVKEEDVMKKLDEVNDEMTQYTLPFYFQTGIGIHPSGSEPLEVYGTLRFEFYDNGVKLSIENFDEKFFIVHKTNIDRFTRTENMKVYDEYCLQAGEAAKAMSKYGKLISKIDKIQEIDHVSGTVTTFFKNAKNQVEAKLAEAELERLQILENYRERVTEQNKLFDKMVKDGEAQWYTLDEYIDAASNSPSFNKYKNAATSFMKKYLKAKEQNQLYAFPEKRWHRDIRYIFDGIFLTLADVMEGSIEGVAEDGVQTWERDGNLVVPTDPKKKQKYIKKNKSFTDYESYDN